MYLFVRVSRLLFAGMCLCMCLRVCSSHESNGSSQQNELLQRSTSFSPETGEEASAGSGSLSSSVRHLLGDISPASGGQVSVADLDFDDEQLGTFYGYKRRDTSDHETSRR